MRGEHSGCDHSSRNSSTAISTWSSRKCPAGDVPDSKLQNSVKGVSMICAMDGLSSGVDSHRHAVLVCLSSLVWAARHDWHLVSFLCTSFVHQGDIHLSHPQPYRGVDWRMIDKSQRRPQKCFVTASEFPASCSQVTFMWHFDVDICRTCLSSLCFEAALPYSKG